MEGRAVQALGRSIVASITPVHTFSANRAAGNRTPSTAHRALALLSLLLLPALFLATGAAAAPRPYLCQITGLGAATTSSSECSATGPEAPGGQFGRPYGLAIDSSDNLWVTDTGHGVVDKFNSSGNYLAQGAGFASEAGRYIESAAFSNAAAKLFVSDSGFDDLWGLNPDATYSGTDFNFGGGCCFIRTAADNSAGPTGGDLYVASENGTVTRIDTAGNPVNFTAGPDAGTNVLTDVGNPGSLAVDPDSGKFYVDNIGHGVVDQFQPSGELSREFSETNPGEPLGNVAALAVDPTSGNLLIADSSHQVIDEFTSSGEFKGPTSGSESPAGSFAPQGLAVNSSGDLYVSDRAHGVVDLFGPALILPKVTYHAPTEVGETSATVNAEADPNGGGEIEECSFEYGETEAYGSTVACSPPTPYTEPKQVSAELSGLSAGHTYHYRLLLSDKNGTQHGADQTLSTNGPPSIDASSSEEVTGVSAILAAQINPDGLETAYHFEYISDQAFQQNLSESKPGFSGALIAPHPDAHLGSGSGDQSALEEVSGLAATTTYHYRAFASNSAQPAGLSGPEQSFETEPALLIGATASEAITRTTATLTSKLDPDGSETAYHFSYITQKAYEEDGNSFGQGAQSAPNPDAHVGAANSDQEISQALTELKAGTTYRFRLLATNPAVAGNPIEGPEASLQTLPAVKIDSTSLAAATDTTATLAAQINPQGGATTYHFSYIIQKAYEEDGNSFGQGAQSAPTTDASIGAGNSDVSVSQSIEGLSPATLYRFRVLATGPDGSTEGPIQSFDTYPPAGPAGLPDNRAYEQVTPVNKDGDSATGHEGLIQASPDGNRITFISAATFPGAEGASNIPIYMATRSAAGWSTQGLLPPGRSATGNELLGWSGDLSQVALSERLPSEPNRGIYLRNTDGTSLQSVIPAIRATNEVELSLADFNHSDLLFESPVQLLSGATPRANNLYQSNNGVLTLAGLLPDGTAPPAGSIAGPYDYLHSNTLVGGATVGYYTQNTLSADGSRVFFTDAETGQLYLRENGATTVQVSASQKTNGTGPGGTDPNGPQPAAFMAATPDGSHVFFTSCEQLTDESTAHVPASRDCRLEGAPAGNDLYRYDAATGHLTDLTVDHNPEDPGGADVLGVLGTSEDGSSVYFAAAGDLTGEEVNEMGAKAQSGPNLYLSHDGSVSFIATLGSGRTNQSEADAADWGPGAGNLQSRISRVSADGNVLLFASTQPLTGYDNAGFREFYRYDATSGQLECVTCNPTGAAPVGNASLSSITKFDLPNVKMTSLTRNLSADGTRVFFESPDALVPSDTNGNSGCDRELTTGAYSCQDVYEWEADGSGTCHRTDQDGGCLFLLSTGKSPDPSYFADASANGNDAFFFTTSSLVGQDNDQIQDIYDARVGGGLPTQNPSTAPPCSGEDCLAPPPQPPAPQTAASAAFSGPPNPVEPPSRCRTGFVRRHGYCVKKPHHTKAHKRAAGDRRRGAK